MPVDHLRPVERRVLRLAAAGLDDVEIGRRFRHSPEWVAQVRVLSEIPRAGNLDSGDLLRPIERRVLRWRESGATYEQISPRFRRTPDFLRQVETLANYKLATAR